ncbi:protein-disulfide reductase DsbD domain-containing protein [Enterovibrio norvegicus]|uniref:protein-disulfide reductase DsbD domain-containing protein n=1 Tax=Enterovibrio norvegicus TaxID=188144 RepID=UPI00352E981E
MPKIFQLAVFLVSPLFVSFPASSNIEPVSVAVKFGYFISSNAVLTLRWSPMPDYYIYNIKLWSQDDDLELYERSIPAAEEVLVGGAPMNVFSGSDLEFEYLIGSIPQGSSLSVQYSSCHKEGYCYPPQRYELNFEL